MPLELGLHVCVAPDYFRAHVEAAVLDGPRSGVRPDGTLGLFHPDRFTFGQPVYLSAIVRRRAGRPGVESVEVRHLPAPARRRLERAIETGVLPMGRLEIARLDNDPNFPERGVLDLTIGGGK